jgi:hypothetical protein
MASGHNLDCVANGQAMLEFRNAHDIAEQMTGESPTSTQPLLRSYGLGERDCCHVRVRLESKTVCDGAHHERVHKQCAGESGEFGC